ncbi:cellulose binding domain-containing protein [Kitasatospora purpeofusca]|uniref:cellulose binding domain-containing protein n=1 Tax=Kitasatospora purpeofusca TaxID=67352 RepID=UPI0035DBAFEB
MLTALPRRRRPATTAAFLTVLLLALSLVPTLAAGPATAAGTQIHQGVGTRFDGTSEKGGGCGVPPAQIESDRFVALNVWDTPGYFGEGLPRPVPADRAAITGAFANGLNCGRWVRITLGDYCNGDNPGQAGDGICARGTWAADAYNGATVDAVVTDSCGDRNEWCRSSRDHLDLSKPTLSQFTLNGNRLPDLESAKRWNNRKLSWSFVPAPDYRGDIAIGFALDSTEWYAPVIITNLPNGIHGVQYFADGGWHPAQMTSDDGQRYEIRPATADRRGYRIRVVDADDQLLQGGREYSFNRPVGCDPCTTYYAPAPYTVSGGSTPPADRTAPTLPAGLAAAPADTGSVALTWQPSTDNVGVTGYDVLRDGTRVGSPTGTSFTDTGLAPGSRHRYQVTAHDAAGNVSAPSAAVEATAGSAPTTPGGPTGCTARMSLTGAWGDGFNAKVEVANTGPAAIQRWQLRWTWPGAATVSDFWNGPLSQQGRAVTVTNADYNGALAPGSSTAARDNGPGLTVRGAVPDPLPALTCTVL